MHKLIVTITPPTPNGNLHLGHIAGPFLAADVFARIQRHKGNEVIFVCYSDDFQSYVNRKAVELSKDRFELAGFYADAIQQTLAAAKISIDWFLKSYNNKHFENAVRYFYEQAKMAGVIESRLQQVPYDEEKEVYGYEALGRGICNYCDHASDASQCENCARAPEIEKMGPIKNVHTGKTMTTRTVNRQFLKLSAVTPELLKHYNTIVIRPYLRAFLEETLQQAKDWPIDRPGECGIEIDSYGQRSILHTWFCGIAGYLAACSELEVVASRPGLVNKFWYDPATVIVHFLGFDCSFSHGIVYPTLLRNCRGMTNNVHLIPNKFLKLEGNDFSTSRGIAIWVNDILKEAPMDAVRFYLALHSPEEETTNFEIEKFRKWKDDFFLPAVQKGEAILRKENKDWTGESLLNEDKPVVQLAIREWNTFSTLNEFSIRGISQALQKLLRYIYSLPETDVCRLQDLYKVYFVMGMAIHPDISDKLIYELGVPVQRIINWMQLPDNVPAR